MAVSSEVDSHIFVWKNRKINGGCRDHHPDEQAWALHLL